MVYTDKIYNFIEENLVEAEILTMQELDGHCNIHGYNKETLEDLLFYYTGWRNLDQAQEALDAGEFYSNM